MPLYYSSTYHSKVSSLQNGQIRVHWTDKMTRWQNICWFIDICEIFVYQTINFKAQIVILKKKNIIRHTWIWFSYGNASHVISKNLQMYEIYWDWFKNISIFESYNMNLTYSEALLKTKTKEMGHWTNISPSWLNTNSNSYFKMGGCCVNGCFSWPEHGIKMFSITENCKKVWGNVLKPCWTPPKYSQICEICISSEFIDFLLSWWRLKQKQFLFLVRKISLKNFFK